MICSSGIGFDPVHGGRRLRFGFHGIWQGTAVLYDKSTRSLWLHTTGECIDGEYQGTRLDAVAGRHVQWWEWKRDHPDTEVMAPDERFRHRYFARRSAHRGLDFFPRGFLATIQNQDSRLPPSTLCLGIKVGRAARAYPFPVLHEDEDGLIYDRVGDVPVVVLFDRETQSAAAHEGRLGDQELHLVRSADGRLRHEPTGSLFDRDGFARKGPFEGERLGQLFAIQAEWYGWYATYPHTTIYAPAAP